MNFGIKEIWLYLLFPVWSQTTYLSSLSLSVSYLENQINICAYLLGLSWEFNKAMTHRAQLATCLAQSKCSVNTRSFY